MPPSTEGIYVSLLTKSAEPTPMNRICPEAINLKKHRRTHLLSTRTEDVNKFYRYAANHQILKNSYLQTFEKCILFPAMKKD